MDTRTTQLTILPPGMDIYNEGIIHVQIANEGSGAFLVIIQDDRNVRINCDEWPAVRAAVNRLSREIEKLEMMQ